MSCQYSQILLAMADLVSTDAGCGGHLHAYEINGERSVMGDTCLARDCHPPRDLGAPFEALKLFDQEDKQSLEEPRWILEEILVFCAEARQERRRRTVYFEWAARDATFSLSPSASHPRHFSGGSKKQPFSFNSPPFTRKIKILDR